MDEMKKLSDEDLEQVSGGGGELVTTDCYYCGYKHVLLCETGLKIIPHGPKKFYDGASKYFCTNARKYFYVLSLPNGGNAIFDDDMKVVR